MKSEFPHAPVRATEIIITHKHWILKIFLTLIFLGGIISWSMIFLGHNPFQKTPVVLMEDQLKDWQTYTSVQYGFQITLPQDWIVDEHANGVYIGEQVGFVSPQTAAKYHNCLDSNNSLSQQCQSIQPFDIYFYTDTNSQKNLVESLTLSLLTWDIYNETGTFEGIDYVTSGENKLYHFEIIGKENEALLKKILSTFKFITPVVTTTIDVTDWKTYTNTEYGFEFKYPPYFFTPVLTEDNKIVFQTDSTDSQDDGLAIQVFKRSKGFNINKFFFGCSYDTKTKTWSVTQSDPVIIFVCPTEYHEKSDMNQYIYDVSDEREWEGDVLIDSKADLLVEIAVQGGQDSKNNNSTLSQILSTFKFTK